MHVGYQPISSIPGGRMDVARDLYRKSAGSDRERDNQGYHDTLGSRDSYSLLLELALQEPTIQNCLKIVESTCLAQGFSVRIEKKNVSEEFQHHLQKYYLPFLSDAIRAMHVYGFVPWRLRKSCTGDPIPEVIPAGTFIWYTEPSSSDEQRRRSSDRSARQRPPRGGDSASRRKRASSPDRGTAGSEKDPSPARRDGGVAGTRRGAPASNLQAAKRPRVLAGNKMYERQRRAMQLQPDPDDDHSSSLLRYKICFVQNMGIEEEDVEIHTYVSPSHDVCGRSMITSAVCSPLSHLLIDYKNIREAQFLMAHADSWNSRAKLICSYAPPATNNMYNVSEGNPITNDWVPQNNRIGGLSDVDIPIEIEQNAFVRDMVTETITESKMSNHKPLVYTLPKNTRLEQPQNLSIQQNVDDMQRKFSKDVASLFGVPWELIGGGYSGNTASSKSLDNTRIFTTNMMRVCQCLQSLCCNVYSASYGTHVDDVAFEMRPTPRIEVQTVQDLDVLLQNGLVSNENAADLSNMVLGMDLRQIMGKNPGSGMSGVPMFVTPKNKVESVRANAAMLSSQASSKKADADVKKASQEGVGQQGAGKEGESKERDGEDEKADKKTDSKSKKAS